MKKMLLATALALLITGCAQQTFTVQNKPAAVAPKETITHHFFVSGIGQKKTVDAAKICGGAENVGSLRGLIPVTFECKRIINRGRVSTHDVAAFFHG